MTHAGRLTTEMLASAAFELAAADSDLCAVVERLGPPPLWDREPGFPTLVHIILEQQVSLASAKAAFDKLEAAVSPFEPAAFLSLDDGSLQTIGFSGQKGRYCRNLAAAVLDGSLDIDAMTHLDDDEVRRELTAITGIGPWTADIYPVLLTRFRDEGGEAQVSVGFVVNRATPS